MTIEEFKKVHDEYRRALRENFSVMSGETKTYAAALEGLGEVIYEKSELERKFKELEEELEKKKFSFPIWKKSPTNNLRLTSTFLVRIIPHNLKN